MSGQAWAHPLTNIYLFTQGREDTSTQRDRVLGMMDPCERTCGCRCHTRRAMSAARQGVLGALCNQRAVWASLRHAGPAHDVYVGMRHRRHRRPMQAVLQQRMRSPRHEPRIPPRPLSACLRARRPAAGPAAARPSARAAHPGTPAGSRTGGRSRSAAPAHCQPCEQRAAARALNSKTHLTKQVLQYFTTKLL